MNKCDVFISYSHYDKERAQGVTRFLEDHGIWCWLNDRDISVGEAWATTITNAIKDSTVVIAILTEHYNNSPSCENEIELATRCHKPILVIKFDNTEPSDVFEYFLTKSNWISASHGKEWLSGLIEAVKYYLVGTDKDKRTSELDTSDSSLLTDTQVEDKTKTETPECPAWKSTIIDNEEKDALLKLSSNVPSKVYLDGEYICEIGIKEVVKIPLNYGAYIVGLDNKENPQSFRMIDVEIPTGTHSKALVVEMPNSEDIKETVRIAQNTKEEIKCFIAGSKTMMAERNAMRVVASNMYHNWKSFNLLIEIHSFDNFEHSMSEKGHQEEYNQFIANKADLVLFLFDNTVGDKTLEELDTAIDSYKKNKRPKIIVYVKKHDNYSPIIEELRNRLKKEDVYWVDYTNIEHLSMEFERDLNALLFKRLHIEKRSL